MTDAPAVIGRAVAAYTAMRKHFYVRGKPLYKEQAGWSVGTQYAYVWPFSRALFATLALAGMPGDAGVPYVTAASECLNGLEEYWNPYASPPAYDSFLLSRGGGDRYHDDNAWIGLALIEAYRMGLISSLERAREVFAFALSGLSGGGVFWVQQGIGAGLTNHDRGTGATAGSAEIGLHLHVLDGSPTAEAATAMLEWVDATLKSPDGLYWNLVRVDGSVDTNLWSYNQGVMIGANVLRYQLSGNARFLDDALRIAERTLEHYGALWGHPPSFNVMLFQNLLTLYPYAGMALGRSLLGVMQTYADWAWNNPSVRDPATDLFYFDDPGNPTAGSRQRAQLRDQGAMTQLYALLAWNPADYARLT